jgi:hypothetical protein
MNHPPTAHNRSTEEHAESVDPVVARRRKMARWVSLAQRTGYALLAVFCVLVLIGFPTGFPNVLTTAAIAAIVAGSVLLAPAIVLSYGIKAADREDREGDWR